MPFHDNLEAAKKELNKAELWKSNHNPPISVLLRKLGFNIRPFHYCSFKSNFLTASVWFGGLWGLLMWYTSWQSNGMTMQAAFIYPLPIKVQDFSGNLNGFRRGE